MITVRTGAWTKEDKVFFGEVLDKGLTKCCFAYNTGANTAYCKGCKNKIACADLRSAMYHIWSTVLRDEAQTSNQENKSL